MLNTAQEETNSLSFIQKAEIYAFAGIFIVFTTEMSILLAKWCAGKISQIGNYLGVQHSAAKLAARVPGVPFIAKIVPLSDLGPPAFVLHSAAEFAGNKKVFPSLMQAYMLSRGINVIQSTITAGASAIVQAREELDRNARPGHR
jgi:hypothetical protein